MLTQVCAATLPALLLCQINETLVALKDKEGQTRTTKIILIHLVKLFIFFLYV